MNKSKLNELIEVHNFFAFEQAEDWQSYYLEPYYLYFNHHDDFFRKGSLFAFYGMIKNWFNGASFAFMTDKQGNYIFHDAEVYFSSFIEASNNIKSEFPTFFTHIGCMVYEIDKKKKLDDIFPNMDRFVVSTFRNVLFAHKSHNILNFDDILQELEI